MNEVTVQQPRQPGALVSGSSVQAIVPTDFAQVCRLAEMIAASGMAPRGIDTPPKIAVAIMHGLEVGFTPMAALQSIAVVNGRPSIWGDGALALVQSSGLMESFKEKYEGSGTDRKAICIVKRKNDPELKTGEFSVADAKMAGLWGKAGPWQGYPDRMLKMRARGFALRDGFSDVFRGLAIAEEMQDVERTAPALAELPPPPPEDEPAPTKQAASQAGPGKLPPPPSDEPEQPKVSTLAEVEADLAKITDAASLPDYWATVIKPQWPNFDSNETRAAMKAAYKVRRDALTPKTEAAAQSEPEKPTAVSDLVAIFEAEAAKAPTFDVLDEAWNTHVNATLEAGRLSRSDVEGTFASIYDKHRNRIEYGDDETGE